MHNIVIDGIQINHKISRPATLAGTVHMNGKCDGVSYSDVFGSWSNAVVNAKISVSLHEVIARIDVENDKIFLPSGTVCKLSATSCIEPQNGYTFWDNLPLDSCNI